MFNNHFKKPILFSIFIINGITNILYSSTQISDGEEVYGLWKKSSSPYIVEGLAVVPYNKTLKIEPGVVVLFKSSTNYGSNVWEEMNFGKSSKVGRMRVNGCLKAVGSKDEPIIFSRNGEQGHWGSIFLYKRNNPNVISYCSIEYGDGITLDDYVTADINHCEIINCKSDGIYCSTYSKPTISYNFIWSNDAMGITLFTSNPIISNNIIGENLVGIYCQQASPKIVNNTIILNKREGIHLENNAHPEIVNSIIFENENSVGFHDAESNVEISYSLLQGSRVPFGYGEYKPVGTNILGKDPLFVNIDDWNFSLKIDSPCKGGGSNGIDMGADVEWLLDMLRYDEEGLEEIEDEEYATLEEDDEEDFDPDMFGEDEDEKLKFEDADVEITSIIDVQENEKKKSEEGKAKTTDINAISVDIEENIPITGMKNKYAIAVVIGNRHYSGDVPDAEFAVRDAKYVKEYLIKAMGYRTGNIFYYTNATLSNMKVAFKELKNAVRPDRSDVFVYYSGHGAPEPDSKQGYFVPVDANPNYIQETGYPVGDLYAILNETGAKSTTVVIDACFSGASDQGMILKNISPIFIEVDKSFLTIGNSAIFTSSTGEQVSSWYREKKHSLFTYYFLKALQGDADSNNDKILTLSEIKNYIDDEVPYMARRLNNRVQTPGLQTVNREKILISY